MNFFFPFDALNSSARELGLVVAVLTGIAFGFVLERAGFGRAQKLVGQFYGTDMTVFKVMFSAIVTALLGTVLLSGLGLMELRAVADFASSGTFLWPMIVGGLLLGAGFIVSGYCPGTSFVAAASGKIDGVVTAVGVAAGTLIYSELQSLAIVQAFHQSGALGHVYLWQLAEVPPAMVALAVVALAVGCFVGAEKLEKLIAGSDAPVSRRTPRRAVFVTFALAGAASLVTIARPVASAETAREVLTIEAGELVPILLEAPWTMRILDLRDRDACADARIPGSECVPRDKLDKLYLADVDGTRDLVLVDAQDLTGVPAEVNAYRGRVFWLAGGFDAWERFALRPAEAPAGSDEVAEHRLREGLRAALTGAPPAPPPPISATAAPARKKAGGGCSG